MLIKAAPDEQLDRIDKYISTKSGISRSQIQRLMAKKLVSVNGKHVKSNYIVKPEDAIEIEIVQELSAALIPENLSLDIPYNDTHVAVVIKPSGMVVYPAAGHPSGTLMNALAYQVETSAAIGAPLRPGVVHRLDKDTSGVMVVALSDEAYYGLIEQFKKKKIKRNYLALIYGTPSKASGEITSGIGRSASDRKKMSVKSRHPKEARTLWETLRELNGAALIKARLSTGRTHQIRVHFASIGHPVLGDKIYGNKTSIKINNAVIKFPRQMLHAELLGFTHPVTGEYLEFHAPLPEDMKEAIKNLE